MNSSCGKEWFKRLEATDRVLVLLINNTIAVSHGEAPATKPHFNAFSYNCEDGNDTLFYFLLDKVNVVYNKRTNCI